MLDRSTLTRARAGDARAVTAVLADVGPLVASLVRRLSRPHEASDDVQAVLTHLIEVLPRFDPDGPAQLTTWAFTVAHRWLLMNRRRRAVELVPLDGGLSAPDHGPGPEDHAHRRELGVHLDGALQRLPDEQRRAFVLTQLYELSLEQVALDEGVPLGTVKSRLHRARASLVLLMGDVLAVPGGRRAAP